MIRVRYFAGAAEAAGTEEDRFDPRELAAALAPAGTTAASTTDATDAPITVGAMKAHLAAHGGAEFSRVLARCSIMVDGTRPDDSAPVPEDATLDVLPPFAGG